ncbi:hypothetical protein [Streptomyces sp. NPDC051286]|uniref:hypothetical protein n=1 Tax=Streptomyces sp. NPDC051286 TaxID=3365647 RepID=UPI0037BDB0A7
MAGVVDSSLPLGWDSGPVQLMVRRSWLSSFKELGFEVGDAFLGEPEVGTGALEPLLELAVRLGELMNTVFEGGVARNAVLQMRPK